MGNLGICCHEVICHWLNHKVSFSLRRSRAHWSFHQHPPKGRPMEGTLLIYSSLTLCFSTFKPYQRITRISTSTQERVTGTRCTYPPEATRKADWRNKTRTFSTLDIRQQGTVSPERWETRWSFCLSSQPREFPGHGTKRANLCGDWRTLSWGDRVGGLTGQDGRSSQGRVPEKKVPEFSAECRWAVCERKLPVAGKQPPERTGEDKPRHTPAWKQFPYPPATVKSSQ